MSPVLSSTARTIGSRRRHARQSTATLFPVSPYATSPRPRAGDAPDGAHNVFDKVETSAVAGLGGSISGCPTADCPPPTSFEAVPHGLESRAEDRTREAAVPLVGIARLAACSPPAESMLRGGQCPPAVRLPLGSGLPPGFPGRAGPPRRRSAEGNPPWGNPKCCRLGQQPPRFPLCQKHCGHRPAHHRPLVLGLSHRGLQERVLPWIV